MFGIEIASAVGEEGGDEMGLVRVAGLWGFGFEEGEDHGCVAEVGYRVGGSEMKLDGVEDFFAL